jgi:hypothetical protein
MLRPAISGQVARAAAVAGSAVLLFGSAIGPASARTPMSATLAPDQVQTAQHMSVVSTAGIEWHTASGSGSAVYSTGNVGCPSVDSAGQCTAGGVWPHLRPASWIWTGDGDDAAHTASFEVSFSIPPQAKRARGFLHITADNAFRAFLNGHFVGSGDNWARIYRFAVSPDSKKNVLRVRTRNEPGNDWYGNPAGLLFRLDVYYECPGHSCAHPVA